MSGSENEMYARPDKEVEEASVLLVGKDHHVYMYMYIINNNM